MKFVVSSGQDRTTLDQGVPFRVSRRVLLTLRESYNRDKKKPFNILQRTFIEKRLNLFNKVYGKEIVDKKA